MTKFFNIFKKPCFWPFLTYFPNFLGNIFFLENPSLSPTTSYGFLASCQNSEKTNNTIPENARTDGRTDRRTDGWTDGRTDRPYFIGPFGLPPGFQ